MLHSYVQTKLDINVLKNPSKKRNVLQKVELNILKIGICSCQLKFADYMISYSHFKSLMPIIFKF